jgi:single-strand DNA-binding protein
MSDLNNATLTGRLVRDPELRRGDLGNLWGVFTLASNYHYKDKAGELQEDVAFVDCKTFGRWAEALAKHRKGDMALAVGRLKTESWEKDGRKQSKLLVICDSVRFFVPQNGSSNPAKAAENEPAQEEWNGKDGKPPF